MTTEELIAKYKVCDEDAKELREFSEFLRLRKRAKIEQAFADHNVQTLHPVYTQGKGRVYKIPGTPQTRTVYQWVIEGDNGRLHIPARDTDDQSKAEEQLKKVMEALGL